VGGGGGVVRTGRGLDVARQQIRDAPVGVAPAGGELGPTVAERRASETAMPAAGRPRAMSRMWS